MSTELNRRIATAVRAIVDEIPVDPPAAAAVRARATARATARAGGRARWAGARRGGWPAARRGGWTAPMLPAAATTVVLLALVAVVPGLRFGRVGAPEDRPVLPTRFAGLSLLTASVSDSPPGPAIALFSQKSIGRSQLIVVGADGRTYRRLDLAERRGHIESIEGTWVPAGALLAPDGSMVAVADPTRVDVPVEVVDLRTGRVRGYRLEQPASVKVVAWSPDGRRLLLWTSYAAPESTLLGQPAVLDVRTGTVRRFGALESWRGAAAFAPDGERIAFAMGVPVESPSGVLTGPYSVVVTDLAGTVRHILPAAEEPRLTAASWSPDGRLLAWFKSPNTLTFHDATGRNGAVPAPVPHFAGAPLCWRSPDLMVVQVQRRNGFDILEAPVSGGPAGPLSRLRDSAGGYARIGPARLACGLVARAVVRDAGSARRGPWPWWMRLVATGAILLVGWRVVVTVRRRA